MNWIKVSERLPEEMEDGYWQSKAVIVYRETPNYPNYIEAYFDLETKMCFEVGGSNEISNVTHWFDPAPPTEEN